MTPLAEAYRPRAWGDVVGQDKAIRGPGDDVDPVITIMLPEED